MAIVLPFFINRVPAGFPSPAADYAKEDIDLPKELIKNPLSTFLVRADGESMIGAGINSGAILIVDRSLTAKNGSIVVACISGEFTIKRLVRTLAKWYLQPENKAFPSVLISGKDDALIWGVVTAAVNQFI
ncbi:LexA family protein [Rhizosphaericola mali]|uniref:Translesion error-prone DNA polymerase V autoproteolytic subunit n=1 Tax=Rhizosphaericola mali TaxID=2545455 RepID=A0A5P2G447_9BACT|nr:translesion error-prone DNA polymerase V autoproteolytic subunit [Rhizosphaericola mali]QES88530.1 translesion error-prone DNA polymerase V autoproteolytic subunit [Rhizosphaericola mali]